MPPKATSPGPVPQDALDYFDEKEITPGFNHTDVWEEEHDVAFTVAKLMEEDILEDVRDLTRRALEEGTPFREYAKELKGLLDESGWSNYNQEKPLMRRLRTIYETNMRTARATGQWQRIERTKRLRPNLLYQLGSSQRHRPVHVDWEGTILPVDSSFWSYAMPPNGHG